MGGRPRLTDLNCKFCDRQFTKSEHLKRHQRHRTSPGLTILESSTDHSRRYRREAVSVLSLWESLRKKVAGESPHTLWCLC